MRTTLHPLRLHSTAGTDISTIFHSFFFIELENGTIKSLSRIPQNRTHLENIESGLSGYISEIVSDLDHDKFGYFVITSIDGSVFNAFWRGCDNKLFIGVSDYFIPSFARHIFDDFGLQTSHILYSTLLKLCELPIISMSDFIYQYRICHTFHSIHFNSLDHPHDDDMNELVLKLLTPNMLATAWESLILEKKVLVVSVNTPLVAYCCEFLRRIVSPLTIVTFSSLLPRETLTAIEAPFPYLVGGCTKTIKENIIDLTETVVIDLDTRNVITPTMKDGLIETYAPMKLKVQLLERINTIMMTPMTIQLNRINNTQTLPYFMNNNYSNTSGNTGDKSLRSQNLSTYIMNQLVLHFTQLNLSLLTARASTGDEVPLFFRRTKMIPDTITTMETIPLLAPPVKKVDMLNSTTLLPQSSSSSFSTSAYDNSTSKGFILHGINETFACGTMQLIRERYMVDKKTSFETCWIEMDTVTFAVYEYVDDLPLIYFNLQDIRSVSPLPVEPEEHVFEMILNYGRSYRFVATDPDSRKLWINYIEKKLYRINNVHPNSFGNTGSNHNLISPKRRNSRVTLDWERDRHEYESQRLLHSSRDNNNNNNNIEIVKLGYICSDKMNIDTVYTLEDEIEMSKFRYEINQTQMVNNLYAQFENENYENIFKSMSMDGMLYVYGQECFKYHNNDSTNQSSNKANKVINSSTNDMNDNKLQFKLFDLLLPKNPMMNMNDFIQEIINNTEIPLICTDTPTGHTSLASPEHSLFSPLHTSNVLSPTRTYTTTHSILRHLNASPIVSPPNELKHLKIQTESLPALSEKSDDAINDETHSDILPTTMSRLSPMKTNINNSSSSSSNKGFIRSKSLSHLATSYEPTANTTSSKSDKIIDELIASSSSEIHEMNNIIEENLSPLDPVEGSENDHNNTVVKGLDSSLKQNSSSSMVELPISPMAMTERQYSTKSLDFSSAHSEIESLPDNNSSSRLSASSSPAYRHRSSTLSTRLGKAFNGMVKGFYKKTETVINKAPKIKFSLHTKDTHNSEERKKQLIRMIQHTAYANKATEDEIHKKVVEYRMKAWLPFVNTNHHAQNAQNTQNKSYPSSSSVSSYNSSCSSSSPLSLDIDLSTEHISLQPNLYPTTSFFNWYTHIWNIVDIYINRSDYEEREDNSLKSLRNSLAYALHDESQYRETHDGDNRIQPLLKALIGYCEEKNGQIDEALKNYAQGYLVDSRIIMMCVAKKFITYFPNTKKRRRNSIMRTSHTMSVYHALSSNSIDTDATTFLNTMTIDELNIIDVIDSNDESPITNRTDMNIDLHIHADTIIPQLDKYQHTCTSPPLSPNSDHLNNNNHHHLLTHPLAHTRVDNLEEKNILEDDDEDDDDDDETDGEGIISPKTVIEPETTTATTANTTTATTATTTVNNNNNHNTTTTTTAVLNERLSLLSLDLSMKQEMDQLLGSHMNNSSIRPIFQVQEFLKWAYDLGDLVGLQAYRLVTELIHCYLCQSLATLTQVSIDELDLDPSCHLGIQRDRRGTLNITAQQKLGQSSNFHRRRASRQQLQQKDTTMIASVMIDRDRSSIALNSHSAPDPEVTIDPCKLSVKLLVRLRELLRSTFASYESTDNLLTIKITPDVFDSLVQTSAFSEFEYETCQLQTISLEGLDCNQLLLFFGNVYNTLIVNAKKGAPGSTIYERNTFMKHSKYDIGGYYYSPLDIEHGVLRASSADPIYFGSFSYSSVHFNERDPRREYILTEPRPLISFFLYTANSITPPLSVLRDPAHVNEELIKYAKLYIQRMVSKQPDIKTIVYLPDIFRIYCKDFGENKYQIMNVIRAYHTNEFSSEFTSTTKFKLRYQSVDWTPILFL